AARGKKRHRTRSCGRRSRAQRDRFADDPVPRPVRSKHARRSVVQRQHDAERHDARAGYGKKARRSFADNFHGERISDSGTRYGASRIRLRRDFSSAGTDVRNRKMTTSMNISSAGAPITAERGLHLYRQMVTIRLFEEEVNDLYTRAVMPGLAHLYIGE